MRRKKEVVELLEILINDLQMLELEDDRYSEAFKDAMALQTYILAINSAKGTSGSGSEVFLQ